MQLSVASAQRNFDHVFASIPIYDGTDHDELITWIDRLEAACYYSGRNIKMEALGRSSGLVQKCILGLGENAPWSYVKVELKRCFSEHRSISHTANILDNMLQTAEEPLRLYIYRYSRNHRDVTGLNAEQDKDPTRWLHFLKSMSNTAISDKITRSRHLPRNLRECFEEALRVESQFQLAEGVNVSRRSTVMNVQAGLEGPLTAEEVDQIRDSRARTNAC